LKGFHQSLLIVNWNIYNNFNKLERGNNMIRIVAQSVVKDDKREEYIQLAKELIEKSKQEQGCISYGLFQDINNPSIITFIEDWEDQNAIDLHNKTEHFKRIVPLFADLRVSKGDVNLYREV
jgi:quinol monooxygenase YgiN